MNKDQRLVNLPDGRDWLWGNLCLPLMDGAMLSKFLIQISFGAVFPSCYLSLGQTMVGVMVVKVTSFQRTYASMLQLPGLLYSVPLATQQATVHECLCWGPLNIHRQVGSFSCGVTAPFSRALVHHHLRYY